MAKTTSIPKLNPVRFIPANDQLPQGYHTWPFDRGFFQQQIREYQFKTRYEQKWEIKDRIPFYIDSLALSMNVRVLDESGKELYALGYIGPTVTLDGNTAPNGDPYNTFTYSLRPDDLGLLGGFYQRIIYFVIECWYSETSSIYFVSEPQYLQAKWGGTLLIDYTNNTNDYQVLFEQTGIVFRMRVEADYGLWEMGGITSGYVDQHANMRKLQEVPVRIYQFNAGASAGLPPYMMDKLDRIFRCDTWKIDRTQFVKDTSQKWNYTRADDNQMVGGTIQMQEADGDAGTTYTTAGPFRLIQLPTDGSGNIIYPFAVNFLYMSNHFSTATAPAFVIDDSIGLTDQIDYLNGAFATANELVGSFDIEVDGLNQYITYTNGVDENWFAMSGMLAMYQYLGLQMATNGDLTTGVSVSFITISPPPGTGGSGSKSVAIIDSNASGAGINVVNATSPTTTGQYFPPDTDPDGSIYNVRVFHTGAGTTQDAIGGITIACPAGTVHVVNFLNPTYTYMRAPANMKVFSINNIGVGSTPDGTPQTLDTQWLTYCKNSLQSFTWYNTRFGGAAFFYLNRPFRDNFTHVAAINFAGNAFTTAQVDAVINDIVAYLYLPIAGTIIINAQGAGAPPGPASAASRATLAAFGWTLITD